MLASSHLTAPLEPEFKIIDRNKLHIQNSGFLSPDEWITKLETGTHNIGYNYVSSKNSRKAFSGI